MSLFGPPSVKRLKSKGDVDSLRRIVENENSPWLLRGEAAEALGELRDPLALDALVRILQRKEFDLRRFRVVAAWALGEIGDARALQPLIDCLKDEYHHIQRTAAWALGRIGDARAVKPLIELPIFAGKPAVTALQAILERSAKNVSVVDLQELAKLDKVTECVFEKRQIHFSGDPIMDYTEKLVSREPVDCSQVRRLSQEEITRRGMRP
jgi:hypothetical protein